MALLLATRSALAWYVRLDAEALRKEAELVLQDPTSLRKAPSVRAFLSAAALLLPADAAVRADARTVGVRRCLKGAVRRHPCIQRGAAPAQHT